MQLSSGSRRGLQWARLRPMPVNMEKAEGQAEHRGHPGALPRGALIERCLLLTRDARRYRQAFPALQLITPDCLP